MLAVIALSSMVAGVIQSVTGFGSGIFLMLFLPIFMEVLRASALSSAVTLVLNLTLALHYRKHILYKLVLMPSLFYILVSSLALYAAPYVPQQTMLHILGGFLLALSIYFLFFPDRIQIKASLLTASICASLSGLFGGLFGIGGPPMVIYFLAATRKKEEYLGTIQFFFLVTAIYNFIFRIIRGIYTPDLLPLSLLGILAIVAGKEIGQRIIDRIHTKRMKKIIYIFLSISGVLNLFS